MRNDRRPQRWTGYLFVAPATLYLAVFSLLPMIIAGWLSLHRWHLLKPEHPFVGLQNYVNILNDPFFRHALYNTFLFVVFSVPLGVISSLLVAALLARPLRGVGLFRTILYIPAVSSQVAISMVWIWILLPEIGLINQTLHGLNTLLDAVSLGSWSLPTDTAFLNHPVSAMGALVAIFIWIGLGPRMILFVAGIQQIPTTLYEAADLDGCSAWHRFRYITLPMLAPTMLFVVVTTTIAAFQIFTPVYMMTKGGPRRSTDVVLYHIFTEAWQKLEFGMASAMTYILFTMIALVALVQFTVIRPQAIEEAP